MVEATVRRQLHLFLFWLRLTIQKVSNYWYQAHPDDLVNEEEADDSHSERASSPLPEESLESEFDRRRRAKLQKRRRTWRDELEKYLEVKDDEGTYTKDMNIVQWWCVRATWTPR
jgi:hypothetical protein